MRKGSRTLGSPTTTEGKDMRRDRRPVRGSIGTAVLIVQIENRGDFTPNLYISGQNEVGVGFRKVTSL